MANRDGRSAVRSGDTVLSFVRSSAPTAGVKALELVHQAAEIFNTMEDNARQIEARAKAMCKDATQRLQHAEHRAESAERALHDVVAEAGNKLQEASRALAQAEDRINAAEDKAATAEIRAQTAEAEAREARHALTLVEEAIRRRLLSPGIEAAEPLREVA